MLKDTTAPLESVIDEDGKHYHAVKDAPLYGNGKFDYPVGGKRPTYIVATFSTWLEYWTRMVGHKNVINFFKVDGCTCPYTEPFDNIDDRWLD